MLYIYTTAWFKNCENVRTDSFDEIEQGIEKYKTQGKVFITGDFNSRTANNPDYIELNRFLDSNQLSDSCNNVLPRVNKDQVLDRRGMRLLDLCKHTGYNIANGRLGKDRNIGEYTFINNNGMSVVDYLILHKNNFQYIKDFEVRSPDDLSDHCALRFCIDGNVLS